VSQTLQHADDALQLKRIARGLRLLTVPMPYLSGLAAAVRFSIDNRVPTMGVFASGRLVANAAFTAKLKENELIFVLAHELLHLALRTHDRARGSHHLEFNYAHDYIINDILRTELGFESIPAGGLDMPGAREKAAEEIVLEMRRNANDMASRTAVFGGQPTTVARVFGPPGQGRGKPQPGDGEPSPGDVLDERKEREMFPEDAERLKAEAEVMREAAAKGLALAKAIGALKGLRGIDPGSDSQVVTALRGIYRTPWETALQRWMDSVAPGERTFTRASRRGAERTDIVLPGRRREGWVLNVVLDTSGSMDEEIPRALGAIADFCDATGVDEIRLLQCDADVTGDDRLSPTELTRFQVNGYGGSDLSPALMRLAADPQVKAAAVITDGDIAFPDEPLPFDVLWILTPGGSSTFQPRYGRVISMQPA
jgi:predicted metal-dependent peptidase